MKRWVLFLIMSFFIGCIVNIQGQLNEMNKFAVNLAERGYWEEAQYWWEKILTEDPDNINALNNLAVAYEKMGDYKKARQFYEKALSIKKDKIIMKNYNKCLKLLKKREIKVE